MKKFGFVLCALAACAPVHAEDSACEGLRQDLKNIENQQRMPQYSNQQDRLREMRKATEWEMQKLRCDTLEKKRWSTGSK